MMHSENIYRPSEPSYTTTPVLNGVVKWGAIMGQSNIDARNLIEELPNDVTNPSTIVKTYECGLRDWDSTISPASGVDGSTQAFSSDTVALNRLATNLGETVYVVKRSKSGSHFYVQDDNVNLVAGDWNINSNQYVDYFPSFMTRLRSAKVYTEQVLGKNFKLVYLWCDIFEEDSRNSTKEQLAIDFKEFVDAVREFAEDPLLPIIHREIMLSQRDITQWGIDLQNEFATQGHPNYIENYNLIPSTGITLQDASHLDTAGSLLVADRALPILTNIYQN
tara:strand:- start:12 stop:845 length:834 start_codon:yes stop_codon:yes gene_type:complete